MSHAVVARAIAYASAARLVEEAVAHATSKGWRVAAVVVDPSGTPVALGRMDGVPAPVVDYAADKAYTAGTLGKSSRAFFERMRSSPELTMGMMNRPRLCAWDGGVAIYENGELLGGLGDVECAEHAIAALGLDAA